MTKEQIEKKALEKPPKIKGWMARDENGELYIHRTLPRRRPRLLFWDSNKLPVIAFWGNDIFPGLKWEDEPIEVELIIRPYSK